MVAESREICRSSRTAREMARKRGRLESTWRFSIFRYSLSNYSLLAARLLDLPVALSSPKDGTLPGLGGIMAAHGAMRQIGLKSRNVLG